MKRHELALLFEKWISDDRIFPSTLSEEILEQTPSYEDMVVSDRVLSLPEKFFEEIIRSFDVASQFNYFLEHPVYKPRPFHRLLRYQGFDIEIDPYIAKVTVHFYLPSVRVSLRFFRLIVPDTISLEVYVSHPAETPGKYKGRYSKEVLSFPPRSPVSYLEVVEILEKKINELVSFDQNRISESTFPR